MMYSIQWRPLSRSIDDEGRRIRIGLISNGEALYYYSNIRRS